MANEIVLHNETLLPAMINTVVADDAASKMLLFDAIQNAESLNEHMNETIIFTDCVMQQGVRKSRTANGQDEPCINVYLISKDGTGYFTQSEGVRRAAETLYKLFPDFGKNSKDGGLVLKCIERKTSNGNTLKTLVNGNK